MIPDGFREVDHELYLMLGELKGSMVALTKAFEDERELRRAESLRDLARDDRFEKAERDFKEHIDHANSVERQVMSNKVEIDRFKDHIGRTEDLQKKIMGIFGLLTFGFAMMLQGMWWLVTHFSEAATFVKGLFKF